jgi:uncharacterized protein (TIGR03435 family)
MAMRPAVLLLMATLVSYGQRGTEPPKYEVASIKPDTDNDFRYAFRIERDGTLHAAGITLKRLMMTAYSAQGFRFFGGPGWVAARRWDVQAKPSRAATDDQIRPMLRALLGDRFQLHVHSETRNMPVYELVVDRNGSKVPTVKDANAKPIVRVAAGSIELTNNTSATFASQLSYALAQPVIDKTGLSGNFDFAIRWTPEPGEDGGPTTAGLPPETPATTPSTQDGPSIFTAILEQLGLRLKSARGPVEVVVIDDVQMPTAN